MTSLPQQVQFMRKIESSRIYTRDAATFEEYCIKTKDCFEIIPDGAIIKPYFDIDYKLNEGEEFNEESYLELLYYAQIKLGGYFRSTGFKENLKFSAASAHKKDKYSFHINILNINTTKDTMNSIIYDINAFEKKYFIEQVKSYNIQIDDFFDESIYNAGTRKMRCVHCCKDNEPERPFVLLDMENCPDLQKDTSSDFNEMLITAYVNEDNYLHKVDSKPKPIIEKKMILISTDTTYDEMLVNMILEKMPTEMSGFAKKYESWRNIGWILKNTFENELGWDLFDRFSKLGTNSYDFFQNLELWNSWKTKNEVEYPLGMGSLIEMLKKENKQAYAEIQKEIKSKKNANMKKVTKEQEKEAIDNVFEKMAKEFEKTHCKIINSSVYIHELPNKIITMSKSKIEVSYEHMKVGDTDRGVPVLFIKKWIVGNDNIRKYDDMDIYPNAAQCPSNIYNMWRSFSGELFTGEYKKNDDALKMILNHIRILCNNEDLVYDYFVKWIAQMVQYPETKTIVPTLISKQGAGKGTLLTLFTKMLGSEKVIETTEPSRDVWGQFNGMMVNSFLVNLNELSKRETMESEGKIKGLITDPTLTINNKGINQFKIKSHHRFIITTNDEEGGMKTTDDDRRNLIIRSSDELIGNKEYFSKLHNYLKDEAVIRTCYDYFKSILDMDKFGQLPIPQTEYQNECKKLSKSPIDLWLEDLTRNNMNKTIVELTGKEAYQYFVKFTIDNNIKYNTTPLKLGVKLTNMKLDGVTKGRHTDRGDTKYYNIKTLKTTYNLGCLIETEEDTDEEM